MDCGRGQLQQDYKIFAVTTGGSIAIAMVGGRQLQQDYFDYSRTFSELKRLMSSLP